ncbi:hypothetical protein ACF3DV_19380 [Chlorogloeopsis fritschii PCC 9212]|uniref:hypothetical protein n=1 Tax=Chlorogloeopsis fritschii TaxID=1124 RepID=UPI0002D59424|nr:hypothetical protein [Chlorogloeopsis fritschii]
MIALDGDIFRSKQWNVPFVVTQKPINMEKPVKVANAIAARIALATFTVTSDSVYYRR